MIIPTIKAIGVYGMEGSMNYFIALANTPLKNYRHSETTL